MGTADPADDVVRAWKRARRAAIRRFHPDRGGSASDLMRALAEIDEAWGMGTHSGREPDPEVTVSRGRIYPIRMGARRLRALVDKAREHLPRNWPGSRRYTRL